MTTLRLVSASPSEAPRTDADAALGVLLHDPSWLARLPAPAQSGVLRDTACALVVLAGGARDSALVLTPARPTPRAAPWHVGLERDGDDVLVSVFRHGAVPDVAQVERRIPLDDARAALLDAIAQTNSSDRGLLLARDELAGMRIRTVAARVSRRVRADSGPGRMRFRATVHARLRANHASEVARADLHALFHRGSFAVRHGGAHCRLDDVMVVLVTEQLVQLSLRALDAQADKRPMLRRSSVAGLCLGLRLDPLGVSLLLRDQRFAPMPGAELAAAVARFGQRLCEALCDVDPAQQLNLRLTALLERVAELDARLADVADPADAPPTQLAAVPESYRAFAASDTARPPPVVPSVGKLRFVESWRAEVPGIDLRSTLLLGDRLIVASSHELACIDRSSGRIRWTRRTRRAASIPTPLGVARLFADGRLQLLDPDDGQTLFELSLAPCVGGSASGAVVNAAGLPHLLLLGEGADHLTAIDLDAHEIRWRRGIERAGRLRLRRAGKLVLVSAGEAPLSAFDLLTGELVWRLGARQRHDHPLTVDGGQVFALTSWRGARCRLEHIDTWSGEIRWSLALPRAQAIYGAPLLCGERVLCLTRDEQRLGVMAFDRQSGELVYDEPACLCRAPAACLVVDDLLIANSTSGELVALESGSAAPRYRHALAAWRRAGGHEGPRSLRPMLRSGALFVPQSDVSVVRPHDGVVLGRVGGDLIPDGLLVDERCGVYVAESSGYLTAYQAQPMLTLIQTL